jgi:hypothetical protein
MSGSTFWEKNMIGSTFWKKYIIAAKTLCGKT